MRSVVLSSLCAAFTVSSAEEGLPTDVVEFLDINCYECHNDTEKKGGLDLEALKFEPDNAASMKLWSIVHDRVDHHEMPPDEDNAPEEDWRQEFLKTFEQTLHQESEKRQVEFGRVRSRRMNRIEYENTLHDLLGVDLPIKDLLPEDPTQGGFSNIADSQQISHHLLQKYLEAIDVSLDEAFRRAEGATDDYSRSFTAEEVSWNPETRENGRGPHFYKGHALSFLTTGNYQGRMWPTSVPESGWYRIIVRAKAHNPPPGRGVWTQIRSGVAAASAPNLFWVGSFEATEEPRNFTFVTWMRKGHRLEMRPGDNTIKAIGVKRLEETEVFEDPKVPATAMEWIKMERIHIGMERSEIASRLFDDLKSEKGALISRSPSEDLDRLMKRFATFAFRRTVSDKEVAPYLDFAQSKLSSGASLRDSLKSGYRALLSSPRFLYFSEDTGKLDDFSIASRLSYFLWSSMPDETLLKLARKGKLSDSIELAKQVERMLNHENAAAFVTNFSDDWLDLRDIDFTTPDTKLYPEFDLILKNSMLDETRSFLQELVDRDLSVSNIIDSDFAMLNERLAKHYGIDGFSGQGLQRTALADNSHRGGVITHGSILKVSANGTTTSPVIRGVWLQERILGNHISPPPDDVPAVEPDIRGATSIREQLDKHRSTGSCMACHLKIDPPGFALETYDVTGGWRQNYRALPKSDKGKWVHGPEVDPSYELANGKYFADVEGFKSMILEHPEKIAKNMVEKILAYATGASIEFADRREIARIVDGLEESDYGFRSLIHACAQSDIFQSK